MKRRLRLAVICDAVEEGWRSMDYVAEMLVKHLQEEHAETFETVAITPRFFRGFERLGPGKRAYNADRAVTRFLSYPVALLPRRCDFNLFHIADHSYAHLARVLPRGGTGVFCHDLDAFEPALPPDGASTPSWRRALARFQLGGLQRAAVVFHSTQGVRDRILDHGLIDGSRLVEAPYGVAEEFWNPAALPLPLGVTPPFLLQVGANFPRKRLDVLFRVFAEVQQTLPTFSWYSRGQAWTQCNRTWLKAWGSAGPSCSLRRSHERTSPPCTRAPSWFSSPATVKGSDFRCSRRWQPGRRLLRVTSPRSGRSAAAP